jgi:hypothetical protein
VLIRSGQLLDSLGFSPWKATLQGRPWLYTQVIDPQFLGISQYSEQKRRPDKLLLRANLGQNNVLDVLNAVSDQDFHSEQLPTPAWATGGMAIQFVRHLANALAKTPSVSIGINATTRGSPANQTSQTASQNLIHCCGHTTH